MQIHSTERVNLEKHRESLTKYCYDVGKVILAVAVVNPVATKTSTLVDVAIDLFSVIVFLLAAIRIERGGGP